MRGKTLSSKAPPANPAQGNQRGQTTLAAELARWQTLADRLATQVDTMHWLRESLLQLQTVLAQVQASRNRIQTLRADTGMARQADRPAAQEAGAAAWDADTEIDVPGRTAHLRSI